MATLTEERVEDILKLGKKKLLELMPKPNYNGVMTGHSYKDLFEKNYYWYYITIGLNGRITSSRKRSAKMNFDMDIDLEHLVELWIKQRGRCTLTGLIMSFSAGSQQDKNPYSCSVDRIDNSKGYVKGNVRLITHWANNAKSTWDNKVFKQCIQQAHTHLYG